MRDLLLGVKGGVHYMLRGYWIWGAALSISGALVVGCTSVSSSDRRTTAEQSNTNVVQAKKTEPTIDKLAQAHAHYAAGVIHEMNVETEAALNEYYQAAIKDPENEWLVLEVSRHFLLNRQPDKALEVLAHAGSRPDASSAILVRLGVVQVQLGKSDLAVAAFRAAIRKSPDFLAGYQNLFLTYMQGKQEPEALKVLEDAGKHSKANPDFLIGLSELYLNYTLQVPSEKEKATKKALELLERAAKLKPVSLLSRLRLADDFNALGDTERAAQLYLGLLKSLPNESSERERVHAKLASIYLRGDDPHKATEQLEAIVREDPTNPQAYFYLGYLAYSKKKPAEAADYFSKTVLLSPDFEEAYYQLALAQISMDQAEAALGTLEKARTRFQSNFLMELWTGLAYARKKEYAEAIKHFTAAEVIAKATDPNRLNAEFYFQLGAAQERNGDYEQAEKYFEKCLQLDPDSAETQNYLGYMWAERGVKLEQARELIEKAVKTEPKNGAYLDSLGWVLFKLNKPQEALEYVLKAVEVTPEPDATLFDHLGDIYAALEQPEKAREAWNKSISLETNDKVRKKLEASVAK
ncbi:MAG TPA: tetratricopeptide repeat protein [Clostridia bacterium]|nr:tetratricopeptide repeat protein [Clostridia bacterium]